MEDKLQRVKKKGPDQASGQVPSTREVGVEMQRSGQVQNDFEGKIKMIADRLLIRHEEERAKMDDSSFWPE